jgi:hypothetical protein
MCKEQLHSDSRWQDTCRKRTEATVSDVISTDCKGVHEFYICGSVHHQSVLLNNQCYAALSSHIYSSLQSYSTCFGCFLHPSSGVQLKL